jgi:hypothetical protein
MSAPCVLYIHFGWQNWLPGLAWDGPEKARLDIIRLGMALACMLAVSVFVLFFLYIESTVRLVPGYLEARQ